MREVRIWVVGLGTVGQWLLGALHSQAPRLASRYGFVPNVVGVANTRDGFVYDPNGLDPQAVLELASARRALRELGGINHWASSAEGLAATEADVLVEVTVDRATSQGARVKELVTLEPSDGRLQARIEPTFVPSEDRLAGVSGVVNAVVCRAEPVGEVTVVGPGAGPELAGQGVFSDLIAVAQWAGR